MRKLPWFCALQRRPTKWLFIEPNDPILFLPLNMHAQKEGFDTAMRRAIDARPLLLVEDDEDDILFMRRALNGAGIKNPLCVIQDGEIAVTYLQKLADEAKPSLFPCLVLLDLKLPRRNGLEVLRWIRQHSLLKTLVVVMLTSSSEPQDIKCASELGANSFLVKPNSHDDLNDLVIRLKAYWLEADLLVKL